MSTLFRDEIYELMGTRHPMARCFEDQLLILERARQFLTTPPNADDAMDALDRRIAEDDVQRLQEALSEELTVVRRNQGLETQAPCISARDFGAVGDGVHNDGPALACGD
jgi:hypothetical protein